MGSKCVFSVICLTGLVAPAAFSQPAPSTPRARTASNRIVLTRGSYLGIAVVEINADRAKALHLTEERGIEVTCVDPGSPADKAGLKQGDVVLEYNGERVEGGEQFIRLVRETPPGRAAKLTVWRNNASQT